MSDFSTDPNSDPGGTLSNYAYQNGGAPYQAGTTYSDPSVTSGGGSSGSPPAASASQAPAARPALAAAAGNGNGGNADSGGRGNGIASPALPTPAPPVSTGYADRYANQQIATANPQETAGFQQKLAQLNNPETGRPYYSGKVDGRADSGETMAAVTDFQNHYNLTRDGVIGVSPYGETGPTIDQVWGDQVKPPMATARDRAVAQSPLQALNHPAFRSSIPAGGGSGSGAEPFAPGPNAQKDINADADRIAQSAIKSTDRISPTYPDNQGGAPGAPVGADAALIGASPASPAGIDHAAALEKVIAPYVQPAAGAQAASGLQGYTPPAPPPAEAAPASFTNAGPGSTGELTPHSLNSGVARGAPTPAPPVSGGGALAAVAAQSPAATPTPTAQPQPQSADAALPAPTVPPGPYGADRIITAALTGDPKAVTAAMAAVHDTAANKIGIIGGIFGEGSKATSEVQTYVTEAVKKDPALRAALVNQANINPQLFSVLPADMQGKLRAAAYPNPPTPPMRPANAPAEPAGALPAVAAGGKPASSPPTRAFGFTSEDSGNAPPALKPALAAAAAQARGGAMPAAPAAPAPATPAVPAPAPAPPRAPTTAATPGTVTPQILAQFKKAEGTPAGVTSSAGAVSEFQITPATAKTYGLDENRIAHDPAYAQQAATTILSDLSRRFDGNLTDMAVAYNAGPQFAQAWVAAGRPMGTSDNPAKGIPLETHQYLTRGGFGAPGATAPTATAAASPAPAGGGTSAVTAQMGYPGAGQPPAAPQGALAAAGRLNNDAAFATPSFVETGLTPAEVGSAGQLAAFQRWQQQNPGGSEADYQRAQTGAGGTKGDLGAGALPAQGAAIAPAAPPAAPPQGALAKAAAPPASPATRGLMPEAPTQVDKVNAAMDLLGLPRPQQDGKDQSRAPQEPPSVKPAGGVPVSDAGGGAEPVQVASAEPERPGSTDDRVRRYSAEGEGVGHVVGPDQPPPLESGQTIPYKYGDLPTRFDDVRYGPADMRENASPEYQPDPAAVRQMQKQEDRSFPPVAANGPASGTLTAEQQAHPDVVQKVQEVATQLAQNPDALHQFAIRGAVIGEAAQNILANPQALPDEVGKLVSLGILDQKTADQWMNSPSDETLRQAVAIGATIQQMMTA